MQSAVDALIWGNSTFLGQYHVPGGTVVFNSVLRNIYFTHQCFSVSGVVRVKITIMTSADTLSTFEISAAVFATLGAGALTLPLPCALRALLKLWVTPI